MAHNGSVTVLYPIAADAEAALDRPLGRAARAREAREIAGEPVNFVSEDVGPTFATREAALERFADRLDGELRQVAPEDRYCALRELAEAPPAPVDPVFVDGRRWPKPAKSVKRGFRLSVSYWRIGAAEAEQPPQARAARRRVEGATLTAETLRAIARQPLRPVRPQQPLDIGLFEAPTPEAPHIVIPDE